MFDGLTVDTGGLMHGWDYLRTTFGVSSTVFIVTVNYTVYEKKYVYIYIYTRNTILEYSIYIY